MIFYGNGTSKLVKKSEWRDKKRWNYYRFSSHLFDICNFIFNKPLKKLNLLNLVDSKIKAQIMQL